MGKQCFLALLLCPKWCVKYVLNSSLHTDLFSTNGLVYYPYRKGPLCQRPVTDLVNLEQWQFDSKATGDVGDPNPTLEPLITFVVCLTLPLLTYGMVNTLNYNLKITLINVVTIWPLFV